MNREEALRRARKLAAYQPGTASEAEILRASEALARLCAEHDLELGELTPGQLAAEIATADSEPVRRMELWENALAKAAAEATGTQPLLVRDAKTCVRWVGQPADVAVAAYWYGYLHAACLELVQRWLTTGDNRILAKIPEYRTRLRNGFLMGLVSRVASRLAEGRAQGERGLIVRKEDAARAWILANYETTKGRQARRPSMSAGAWMAGTAAGERLPLSMGVGCEAGRPELGRG